MGSLLVVVAPPFLDAGPGIGQGKEPRGVQALGPEPGVEGLDERVVRGLSGPGEVNLDTVQISPVIEQATGELRAIINPQALRLASGAHELVQNLDHLGCSEVGSRMPESPSRVWMSTTVRIRIGRPSNSWSDMKSMAQISFGAAAPGRPWR